LKAELAAVLPEEPESVGQLRAAMEKASERIQLLGQKREELASNRRKAVDEWTELGKRLLVDERDLLKAEQAKAEAEKLLASLKAQRCHTCGQEWLNEGRLAEAAQDLLKATEETLAASFRRKDRQIQKDKLNAEIEDIGLKQEKVRNGISTLNAELATLDKAKVEAKLVGERAAEGRRAAIRERFEAAMDKLVKDVGKEREPIRQCVSNCQQALESAKRDVYRIETKMDTVRQRMASLKKQNEGVDQLWAAYNSARLRIEKCEREARAARALLQEKSDLQEATRAFLGAISQGVLDEIREEANLMLAALPNVAGVGIRFTAETPREGGMRQEIRTVISVGDEDDIDPEAQLSGGQLTSVELAVDRAVSKVLRRRYGGLRLPSWMALDESFDGHDLQTKEACLDFLRSETSDSQILIIDHASEFREAFEHTISVTADDQGSKIDFT
jgi:DNA repair exonuclease SbcCD ATPase subunit